MQASWWDVLGMAGTGNLTCYRAQVCALHVKGRVQNQLWKMIQVSSSLACNTNSVADLLILIAMRERYYHIEVVCS